MNIEKAVHAECGNVIWMQNRMPTEQPLYFADAAGTKPLNDCPFCGLELEYDDVIEIGFWEALRGQSI
jgi:hypothetical protein